MIMNNTNIFGLYFIVFCLKYGKQVGFVFFFIVGIFISLRYDQTVLYFWNNFFKTNSMFFLQKSGIWQLAPKGRGWGVLKVALLAL